ncbi:CFEM domain-containing protein [Colletotrichum karsti]|uniref:CFEM domain-containing protein n=1 Tax=Colletotrichum karsti TaxID=1095194 RepID=A0A9P6IC93_9PEZI|nr:CFEM domain-containing protein [Colletotrichum karsti]KAF9877881.1 CFEM domain-containing protein [Colletotrichum karsti]
MCRPLSLYWLGWNTDHSNVCFDFNKLIVTHAFINIVLDVWMLILPLTQLYGLNLILRKKIGVMLMFSVGLFITAVSAIRISTMLHFTKSSNVTSESLWVYVWTFTELCVGVFAACMPNAGHLWRTIFGKRAVQPIESKAGRNVVYETEMVTLQSTKTQKERENSVVSGTETSTSVLVVPQSCHSAV